jgi:hypothetical protein
MRAVKLLITNIQPDVEIVGRSAVDIVDRALYYLREKDSHHWPTPSLITHYLMNDPGVGDASMPYVPLGQVEAFEDPRLIRIANYEEGASGRHDAAKVLTPFVRSLLGRREVQKVAVFLYQAESSTKVAQSILEMVRGGLASLPLATTIFHEGASFEPSFVDSAPLPVRALHTQGSAGADARFREMVAGEKFDYVILFESSGMYRGEDVVGLASQLVSGRLDAVWGSRRLSPRDIEESIRFRFRNSPWLRAVSSLGSHALSLGCLALFGRYVSDTLSGARAIRADDALATPVPLTSRLVNHHLLAHLLRRKADILEVPVQFVPLSPDRVRRTTVLEGIGGLGVLARGRFLGGGTRRPPPHTTADLLAKESRSDAASR